MKRRRFIKTAGLAAALAATGYAGKLKAGDSVSVPAKTPGGRRIETLGLQLYTVRRLMAEDVRSTLELVAAAGYGEVEFAGYFDVAPREIRTMLDDVGLTSPSSHVTLEALQSEPEREFEIANTLGQTYLVVPWIAAALRQDLDGYRRVAESLNRIGERAASAGLQIAYHNHDFEFEPMDGSCGYDVLLEETDAALVKMQLDLFWVWFGGASAVSYLSADPGRYVSCHIKDGWADGEQSNIGDGDVDLASDLAAGEFQHYFVEHDAAEDPAAFIRSAARVLADRAW